MLLDPPNKCWKADFLLDALVESEVHAWSLRLGAICLPPRLPWR